YLSVRRDAFPDSVEGRAIVETLAATYDPVLPDDRRVDRMPLACARTEEGRPYWSGSDNVLGPLAHRRLATLQLPPDTGCPRHPRRRGRGRTSADGPARTAHRSDVLCRM